MKRNSLVPVSIAIKQLPAWKLQRFQQGLTLIELLVASATGLLVLAAGAALLLSSKAAYIAHDEHGRLQESGRYALLLLSRAVQQAGYEPWDQTAGTLLSLSSLSATVSGLDARSLKAGTAALEQPLAAAVNGSDVLALRFFGAGTDTGDGSMLNCAGFAVPASADLEHGRGWSIFFVGKDQSGEPELRCKYQGKTSWNSEAMVRGVESFQVLYGLDSDADGLPNQFLNASALDRLDQEREGAAGVPDVVTFNQRTHWKQVVALKLSVLMRSGKGLSGRPPRRHALFGPAHAAALGTSDSGTVIDEDALSLAERSRLRQVFSTTVYLRNLRPPPAIAEAAS